jgi:putative acetyltransferase
MAVEYRRATIDDAPGVARLMAHPEVFGNLMQMPYESVDFWRKRLEGRSERMDALHLLAIDEGEVVGSAGLFPSGSSPRTRHEAHLGMVVLPKRQRQGIGSELLRRLLDWADNWSGYLRIGLQVYTDNHPAIALYQRFGFETEGRLRMHALRDGQYVDSFTMARLHPRAPTYPLGTEAPR